MAKTVHARTLSVQSIDYKYGKVIIPPYEVDVEFTPQEEAALDSGINANMIPSTAGANNKLADRQYVDDAVSEYSAHFLGTSAPGLTEQEFLEWADSLEKDNNDYCNWLTTDIDNKTIYKRYKYNGTQWLYEYDVADPSSIPTALSQLSEDTTHRVVTDEEKSTWSGKADIGQETDTKTVNSLYGVKAYSKDLVDTSEAYLTNLSTVLAFAAGIGTVTSVSNPEWKIVYIDANNAILFGKRSDDVWCFYEDVNTILNMIVTGYILDTTVVPLTSDVTSQCDITGAGNSGRQQTIIYTNSSGSNKTVTIPTTYSTPDGQAIELICPNGGYCEVNYLNIGGVIFARGI